LEWINAQYRRQRSPADTLPPPVKPPSPRQPRQPTRAAAGASRPDDKSRALYDGDHSKNAPARPGPTVTILLGAASYVT